MSKIFSNRSGLKLIIISMACFTLAGFALSERIYRPERIQASVMSDADIPFTADPAKARAAFNDAVKVFFSARCANCHPGGNSPTQGDAMTPHQQNVVRGREGKGIYGMQCATCHQKENLNGEHMPPGVSSDWHMPGKTQKMVFQGVSAGQLCRNFKDPSKNGGHKTLREAMDHIQKRDPLVVWGWEPGNGRTLPPMPFEAFSAKIEEWVKNGGACPE